MKNKMLHFKKIDSDDLEFIYKALSDPELTKFYGVHFDSLEETKEQMEWYSSLMDDEKGIWWKIRDKESGNWIGASGFNDWDHQKRDAEIGCWVLPEFWGKGFGSEIMKATISYGFDEMNLKAINGYIDTNNLGIKKVLKKFNFEHLKSHPEKDSKTGLQIISDHYQLKKS
jgi:ribosomal-protein-alanine N-acetyltransferase